MSNDRRIVWATVAMMLFGAWWRVTHHLSAQQIQFAVAYAEAKFSLAIGLNPLGLLSIDFHRSTVTVERIVLVDLPVVHAAWTAFWQSIVVGAAMGAWGVLVSRIGFGLVQDWLARRARERLELDRRVVVPSAPIQDSRPARLDLIPALPPQPRAPETSPSAVIAGVDRTVDAAQPEFDFEGQTESSSPPESPPDESALSAKIIPIRQPGRVYRGTDR